MVAAASSENQVFGLAVTALPIMHSKTQKNVGCSNNATFGYLNSVVDSKKDVRRNEATQAKGDGV